MEHPAKLQKELKCERCGRWGAIEFEGLTLCAECAWIYESCCPEFGDYDLTQTEEELPKKKAA